MIISFRLLHLGGMALILVLAIAEAAAQGTCDLLSSQQATSAQATGGRVTYVSRPIFECSEGTRIEADSSVTFEGTSFSQLFGHVFFRDGQRELRADRAQYFSLVGRLQAQGSVRLIGLDDGSLVTGEDLILLQEGDGRAEDDMIIRGGRPHARLYSRRQSDVTLGVEVIPDEPMPSDTPFDIDADLIHLVSDHLLEARGRVQITRNALFSYGDSMAFQQDIGTLTLYRNARIISPDEAAGDTLDLRADTITMVLQNNVVDEMKAVGEARLLAEQVNIRGPTIRLLFAGDVLERIVSVGMPPPDSIADRESPSEDSIEIQPEALADDLVLTGDSIEIRSPGGEVETVSAIGMARGVSSARDSINTEDTPELIRRDWIEGHTIIATFGPSSRNSGRPPEGPGGEAESGREHVLEKLVAQGGARSFYRSAPGQPSETREQEPGPLELNYVLGDEIRLFMLEGEVSRMEVDQARGAFFQPDLAPTRPPPPVVDTTSSQLKPARWQGS